MKNEKVGVLELICDILERLRVVERQAYHLLRLVKFLSNYYKWYYKKMKGLSEDIIYERYTPALELIIEDIETFREFILKLNEYVLDKKLDLVELKKEYKNIICKGFGKEKDNLFEMYAERFILTDKELETEFEILQFLRDNPLEQTQACEISLGSIVTAVSYLAHSIEQSLGGMFVGSLIEHQPSVYIHKDLYHAMYYLQILCDGYNLSLIHI